MGIGLAAVAVVAIIVLAGGDDSNQGTATEDDRESALEATAGPEPASVERLREVARSAGQPVYWAGKQPGNYELTIASDGSVFVRYLPEGVPIGSREVTSLTVATYPYADALAVLQAAAVRPRATRHEAPGGGIVVGNKADPNTVYVAFPDVDYQIEVLDPQPGRALELATSGAIEPIE
jgi:hypothetical protein